MKWGPGNLVKSFSNNFHTGFGLMLFFCFCFFSCVDLIHVSNTVMLIYAQFEPTLCLTKLSLLVSSPSPGPEQVQGSFRNQVLQSESCSMEQKSIIAK